jgi:hypothetical protein
LALYKGRTVAEIELVAVTAKPDLVARFTRELIGEPYRPSEECESAELAPLRVVRGDEE